MYEVIFCLKLATHLNISSGSNFLPECVEGTSKVLIIRCSQGFFLLEGGGGRY